MDLEAMERKALGQRLHKDHTSVGLQSYHYSYAPLQALENPHLKLFIGMADFLIPG